MNNRYDGSHANCKLCGNFWKCTRQEAEKEPCSRCDKILNDYPEIWDWILGVIKKKLDAHEQTDH